MKIVHSSKEKQQLIKAIMSLETIEECKHFFEDLCSQSELEIFNLRLLIARLLIAGHSYESIQEITGASYNTIAKIKKITNRENNQLSNVLKRVMVARD
ncbi:YerC/YecD family TrpR-related protein [Lysinibacillus fusiformis]|uniref:YerC/YecD family TrpR-related protein n=1 Tax=Lysinibacillus sp. PWR01 TaxID=3342384 RepID=UPI00372D15B5